mmetsp:Transcript_6480/g.18568  ORF Transcript_6480/g.18568 Transcript_6480/m.18568 type:complete len:272 (+) Transcript_6480:330-1145(+)
MLTTVVDRIVLLLVVVVVVVVVVAVGVAGSDDSSFSLFADDKDGVLSSSVFGTTIAPESSREAASGVVCGSDSVRELGDAEEESVPDVSFAGAFSASVVLVASERAVVDAVVDAGDDSLVANAVASSSGGSPLVMVLGIISTEILVDLSVGDESEAMDATIAIMVAPTGVFPLSGIGAVSKLVLVVAMAFDSTDGVGGADVAASEATTAFGVLAMSEVTAAVGSVGLPDSSFETFAKDFCSASTVTVASVLLAGVCGAFFSPPVSDVDNGN